MNAPSPISESQSSPFAMVPKPLHAPGHPVWLYLIRIPPIRLKIGYAGESIEKRMRDAYTFNPDIEILYECLIRQHWESPIRHYATHNIPGLKPVRRKGRLTEVFEYDPDLYDSILETVKGRIAMMVSTLNSVYQVADFQSMAEEFLRAND